MDPTRNLWSQVMCSLHLPAKAFNKVFFPEHAGPMMESTEPGRANPVALFSSFVGASPLFPPFNVTVRSRHTRVAPFSGFFGSGVSIALLGENITALGMSCRVDGGTDIMADILLFETGWWSCCCCARRGKYFVGDSGGCMSRWWLPAVACRWSPSDDGHRISCSCIVVPARPNGLRPSPCFLFADCWTLADKRSVAVVGDDASPILAAVARKKKRKRERVQF